MPLWMQLLISGGILQDEAGDDGAAGGGGVDVKNKDGKSDDADADDDSNSDKSDDGKPDNTKKKPTDAEAKLLKEVMQRKASEKAVKEELEKLKAQVGDVDLEKAKELLEKSKQAEESELEAKGEYERLKQRMAEAHQSTVKTLNDEIAELKQQNQNQLSTINKLTVGAKFAQSKYIADELILPSNKAQALYADHFDIDENGNIAPFDKPKGAQGRTPLVDEYGASLNFDQAMRKIIESDPEKDHLIKSNAKFGAGSESRGKGNQKQDPNNSNLSGREKIGAGLGNLLNPKK